MFDPNLSHASPERPVIYTGRVQIEKTGKEVLARLDLIEKSNSYTDAPAYHAVFTIFLGDEDSNEYVAANYDDVRLFPDSREALFQRSDHNVARQFPRIRLKFSPDGEIATGKIAGFQVGDIGTVELTRGWDAVPALIENGRLIRPLAGFYDTDCDYATVEMKSLHLVASRIFSDATSNHGILGAINYIGNATCSGPAYNGYGNCAHIGNGLYNFFEDLVILNRGGWICQRAVNDTLQCNIVGSRAAMESNFCIFKRRMPPSKKIKQVQVVQPPVGTIRWQSSHSAEKSQASKDIWDCGSMNRVRDGVLTHFRDGRQQLLTINLSTFHSNGSDPTCTITGTASLKFGPYETLNFELSPKIFNMSETTITLVADQALDPILTLDPVAFSSEGEFDSGFKGFWHSRLYGVVGGFSLINDERPYKDFVSPVMGANGRYDCSPKNFSLGIIGTPAATSRVVNWDPFNQLKYSGMVTTNIRGQEKNYSLPGFVTPIIESSFDYFTNSLVLDGHVLYAGYIDTDGLHLWGMTSRKYVSVQGEDEQVCMPRSPGVFR
jgi:hypothetical protein